MLKVLVEKYLKGQITAHERMIRVLEIVREYEPLKNFENKVINKRINDCFRDLGNEVKKEVYIHYLTFKYYQHKVGTYNLELSVVKPEGESYPYSITSECTVYDIFIVDGKRFSHANFITAIDKKIGDLENDLVILMKELADLENIVAEYTKITDSIASFNKKYSYFIRQDMQFR